MARQVSVPDPNLTHQANLSQQIADDFRFKGNQKEADYFEQRATTLRKQADKKRKPARDW